MREPPHKPFSFTHAQLASLSSSYALIRVSGIAAASFLQGQLTCDINQLKNSSSLAAHCNTKGRVRALYRIFQEENEFYLRCPKSIVEKALSFLEFYARFSKVQLTPITDWALFGIIVPKIDTHPLPFPAMPINATMKIEDHVIIRVPGNEAWDRYEVYTHGETVPSWLSTLKPLTENEWSLSEILAGIPDIFPETSEQFLPHYIGLPQLGAVSFSKGCYIGQEIIARMEYRSKQQKYHLNLTTINLDSLNALPKPGDTLPDGVSVYVSLALIPNLRTTNCPVVYALVQTPVQLDGEMKKF